MRPGQTAPECRYLIISEVQTDACFNEAGADCPGMRGSRPRQETAAIYRFNEAGADCPGMLRRTLSDPSLRVLASMRPGQTAPECTKVAKGPVTMTWGLQ